MTDRTGSQLETLLRAAANAGDMNGITSIVNSLTDTEKSEVRWQIYDYVLKSIADYSVRGTGDISTDALSAATMGNFMAKVGKYTSGDAISNAMLTLSADRNLAALDAVTDYLTSTQKSAIPSSRIDETLGNLVSYSTAGGASNTSSNVVTATAIRDLMVKLGTAMGAGALTNAMLSLSADHNFAALDAVTDYLTAAQKTAIFSLSRSTVDQTLINVALFSASGGAMDIKTNQAASDAIRNLLIKLGTYVSGDAVGYAMTILSADHNFFALDAVTDHLTSAHIATLSSTPATIGRVLNNIALYSAEGGVSNTVTNVVSEIALRDFMGKLGAYVGGFDIGKAMVTLVVDHNFAALDAVTDYLTSGQKSAIPVASIDKVLSEIVLYSSTGGPLFDADVDQKAANAIRDVITKLGAFASNGGLATDVGLLLDDHNLMGVGAILDGVSDSTASYIKGVKLDALSSKGVSIFMDTSDVISGAAGDDVIFSRGGNDNVHGNNGNDKIYGGNGNDILYGDAGNDLLNGGAGVDTLFGGAGSDIFVFEHSPLSGKDVVVDFRVGEGDKLDLSNLLSGFDSNANAITDFVTQTTVSGNTTLFVDADGKGAGAAVAVVTLMGVDHIDIQAIFNGGQLIA